MNSILQFHLFLSVSYAALGLVISTSYDATQMIPRAKPILIRFSIIFLSCLCLQYFQIFINKNLVWNLSILLSLLHLSFYDYSKVYSFRKQSDYVKRKNQQKIETKNQKENTSNLDSNDTNTFSSSSAALHLTLFEGKYEISPSISVASWMSLLLSIHLQSIQDGLLMFIASFHLFIHFPSIQSLLYKYHYPGYLILSVSFNILVAGLFFLISPTHIFRYLFVLFAITFLLPAYLCTIQHKRRHILGPWDIAVPFTSTTNSLATWEKNIFPTETSYFLWTDIVYCISFPSLDHLWRV